MTDTQEERKKYFYDFGDAEPNPSEKLPKNIEEFNKRVEAKKQEILRRRSNNKKIQQLRNTMSRGGE